MVSISSPPFLILRLYQTHFNISDYNICIFDDIFPTTKAIAMFLNNLVFSIPSILAVILIILYLNYKYSGVGLKPLYTAFFLGVLSFIPIFIIQYLIEAAGFVLHASLKRMLFYSFFVEGFVPQMVVLSVLMFFFYRQAKFRTTADGILYSLFVTLGLSVFLIPFTLGQGVFSEHSLIFKMAYMPCLVVSAISLGFFTGLSRQRNNTLVDLMTGLIAASFFQGLYIFCMLTNEIVLWVISGVASAFISMLFIYKAVTNHKQEQKA